MFAGRTRDRSDFDRRRLRPGWACAVVVVLAAPVAAGIAATPASAGAAQAGPTLHAAAPAGRAAVPGEIVVGFRSGVDASERAATRSAADVRARRNLLARRAQLVKVESGQTVQEAITALEKRADVRYAEPNWIYQAGSTTPDDPRFGGLWGLHNTGQAINGQAGTADVDIDAPEAWDVNRGSPSTVVAVVDSGVAFEHPDLAPNMWRNADEVADNGVDDDGNGRVDDVRGWDFVGDDNNPWDYTDHGTHVAGTIAARGDNGVGVAGVAWQASIMDVRALNASGSGSNADIADAFTYAAASGAKVINASLGGPAFSQALSDAVTNHPDSLFVVSAGNAAENNDMTPAYPCSYTAANLICVAATDNTDALAGFSNYGATSVDLAAPGVDIASARPHYISPDALSDGFESGLGKWTVQSGPWGTATALSTTWLVDSPGANYANNADWAIRTSSTVDVGDRTDCVLKFRYGTFLQSGSDWLDVQSSTDGTAWTRLVRIGDTNGVVRSAGVELGAAGSRYYRYRLTSDASTTRNGVYIDNVRIACPGGPYGSDDYQHLSGTSMASPHVAGAAAVLFSRKPSATVAEVKAALMDTGDPIAALSANTVSGRRLNLDAALRSPAIRAGTATVISSHDPDPSAIGQAVAVHYSVAVDAPGGSTPTGTVTVSDGAESCMGTVAAGQCTLAFTTAGPRALTATYTGDAYHNPSTPSGSVSHQVNRFATTTAISSDPADPSTVGQAMTVRFTVAPVLPHAGSPTGNVTVSDGVDSCMATVAAAECDISLTTEGARSLTATYAGDSNFSASTSASEPHTVNPLATTTTPPASPSLPGAVMRLRVPSLSVFGAAGSSARCRMRTGRIRSCTVRLLAGRRVLARGRSTSSAEGNRRLTVTLALTRYGRTLLSRRVGGVRARVRARGATSGGARLAAARTRAMLRVERFTTPAGAWMPSRPGLTAHGRSFLRSLQGKLIAVARLRCDGHDANLRMDSRDISRLSLDRAAVMCQALADLGVRPRPRLAGHGNSEPIASNTTRSGRAKNRRVEVTITHRPKRL